MEKELIISACIPDERSVKSLSEDAANALAHSQGLDFDLLRKTVVPGANLGKRILPSASCTKVYIFQRFECTSSGRI